jgi:hypothetical protein
MSVMLLSNISYGAIPCIVCYAIIAAIWRETVMSEYQRYEFMTSDKPLTHAQLDAVEELSSHIEASSTHAIIEYHHGDFKHNPIDVLHEFFDGFLYWANWGSPEFALRFPHGILPADLIDGYDFEDFVTFTRHPVYDILDISFGDLSETGVWMNCELASIISIRDELMQGDLRALYIAWLASHMMMEDYDEEDEDEEDEDEEDDGGDEVKSAPAVPPGLGTLTEAQQELAELLQVPEELIVAAAQYNHTAMVSIDDDFVSWVELLPQDRRNDYLVRLASNESGLSHLLVRELRELGLGKTTTPPAGEHVPYTTLLAESKAIAVKLEREKYEQEQLAHQRHLQNIHDHQGDYWHRIELAVGRGTGAGYDEATRLLIELREATDQFKESQEFQVRFRNWIQSHRRRPAFIKRLHDRNFTLPTM